MKATTPPRDGDWFEALFRTTVHHLQRFAARRVPPDRVDDVVAETYASAWHARERIPDPALPWLYRTAGHHVLHDRRGDARRTRLVDRIAAEPTRAAPDPADLVPNDEVRSIFVALSPVDAEILRLSAWEELSAAEIAFVLGCSGATARVRLHRARRRAASLLASTHSRTVRPAPVLASEESR